MAPTGKNRIMIFGPKDDGSYVVEFRTAAGEALAIPLRRGGGDQALPEAHAALLAGERNPDALCEQTLKDIRREQT
jgi:hypothetical protein